MYYANFIIFYSCIMQQKEIQINILLESKFSYLEYFSTTWNSWKYSKLIKYIFMDMYK